MTRVLASEIDADVCSTGRTVCFRLVDDHLRELVLGTVTHVAEVA